MVKSWLNDKIKELYPDVAFDILTPPNPKLGDYSVNLPFILAKSAKGGSASGGNPVDIGTEVLAKLNAGKKFKKYFNKIEFAPPGFINFYLSDDFLTSRLGEILEKKENFGSGKKKGLNINLEFVSANPTGPLTVANVRAASFGDTLANILKKTGFQVSKEYYINDAGNQVRILGESVARRYLRLRGKSVEFPENMYQGEYITDIAREIEEKALAGEDGNFDELVEVCRKYAVDKLLKSAKSSMASLGVNFDVWFSEKTLHESGEIEKALKILNSGEHVYEKDSAKWIRLDDSGENDAVVVKSDGKYSYLMGDIAYTKNKFSRGFDKAMNIWGTDHHGDVPRLLGGVKALGYEDGKLEILLHQLVFVKSGGEKQRMSKRKGEFVLLDDLLNEVGSDAIRFFFLVKDLNTHMEFDIDLAKEQSKKNPVFYIQYAYARLNSIFEKLRITNDELMRNAESVINNPKAFKEPEEFQLMRKMARLPELLEEISQNYQVHRLAQYSFELAGDFHNFYEKHRVVGEDKKTEEARALLCLAVKNVLGLCLGLMGLSAPERMDAKKSESA